MGTNIFSANSFSRFDGKLLQNEFFVNARASLQFNRVRKYDALGKRSLCWHANNTFKDKSGQTKE